MPKEPEKLESALQAVHAHQKESPPPPDSTWTDAVMAEVKTTKIAPPQLSAERAVWLSVAAAAIIAVGCVAYLTGAGTGIDVQLAELLLVDPTGLYGTPY